LSLFLFLIKQNQVTTIGGAFIAKEMKVRHHRVSLGIWDTAGQERFRSMTPMYLRGSSGVFLVFDVTNPSSFEQIHEWLQTVHETDHDQGPPVLVLVGSKADLRDSPDLAEPCVEQEQAQQLALDIGATYFETSAVTGQNVEEVFMFMAECVLDQHKERMPNSQVSLDVRPKASGGCCGGS